MKLQDAVVQLYEKLNYLRGAFLSSLIIVKNSTGKLLLHVNYYYSFEYLKWLKFRNNETEWNENKTDKTAFNEFLEVCYLDLRARVMLIINCK